MIIRICKYFIAPLFLVVIIQVYMCDIKDNMMGS